MVKRLPQLPYRLGLFALAQHPRGCASHAGLWLTQGTGKDRKCGVIGHWPA